MPFLRPNNESYYLKNVQKVIGSPQVVDTHEIFDRLFDGAYC